MTIMSRCEQKVLTNTEMLIYSGSTTAQGFVFRANRNSERKHQTHFSFLERGYVSGDLYNFL